MVRVVIRIGLLAFLAASVCGAQSAPVSPAAPATLPTAPATGSSAPIASLNFNPLGEARALYRRGDFTGAIGKYRDILKANPRSPDAYAGMVRVYLKQKEVDLAATTAEEGLSQIDSPRLRVARAEVWFREGKIAEAETEWVKTINAGYPDAHAFLGLYRVRGALAMHKTAKVMIDRAHELDPDDPDIYEEWIGTLSRAERIQYLEAALAGANNWDAERREDVVSYLAYLKERVQQKGSPCRLVSSVKHTETPLVPLLEDPQHLRGYGLTVALNGHKSKIMLDTGASGIVVRRAIAEHAGISKIVATKIGGIGDKGRKDAYVGVVDSIKIGELEFRDCPIEVIESRSVAGEEGLIGADVFEDFLVDIDFPNEKLRLSELPKRPGEAEQALALKNDEGDDAEDDSDAAAANGSKADGKAPDAKSSGKKSSSSSLQDRYVAPEMKNYTRFFRFGHDVLIPTTIGNVPYKLFLMDTGALMNAISPAAAREVTKVHKDSSVIIEGISGRVNQVYSANKAVLQFGRLKQENQDLTAFDTKNISDNIGTEVSGFLGFVMLRMLDIKIDYRDALVDFQYDEKRFGR